MALLFSAFSHAAAVRRFVPAAAAAPWSRLWSSSSSASLDAEALKWRDEADAVQRWWDSPRFEETRRHYTAKEVVAMQGTVSADQTYYANVMAKKAWTLFKDLAYRGDYTGTFGILDPIQAILASKYLKTLYVSGWQCSSTASTTHEPGPDVADYPSNTVPNHVMKLHYAQLFHDRKQRLERSRMSPEQRAETPMKDFLAPIIADGDTGHGGLSSVMKLTQMFVRAGAAGIHLEDQEGSAKKCGHLGGKVLVSTQEHAERLQAARLQCDIMGTETLIVARTDAEAAGLLRNLIDPRDEPFVLGTTNEHLPPMVDLFQGFFDTDTAKDAQKLQETWVRQANLCTYVDAVKEAILESGLGDRKDMALRWEAEAKGLRNRDARALAKSHGFGELYWDCSKPRTREGFFLVKPGIEMCIARAKAYAPYADLIWMETKTPTREDAFRFAQAVRKDFPNKMLAYNLSPSFNWEAAGMDSQSLEAFSKDLGEMGYVFQFITLAGFHANALAIDTFAKDFKSRGMRAYCEEVQREERLRGVETLKHQRWSGAELVDAQLSAVQGGISSTLAMGEGVTEAQFETSKDDPDEAFKIREKKLHDFDTMDRK